MGMSRFSYAKLPLLFKSKLELQNLCREPFVEILCRNLCRIALSAFYSGGCPHLELDCCDAGPLLKMQLRLDKVSDEVSDKGPSRLRASPLRVSLLHPGPGDGTGQARMYY